MIHIRWGIRRDLPDVLEMEWNSYERPWYEKDFISMLRNRNMILMVGEEENNKLVSYMVYELRNYVIYIHNFTVHPDHRRQGIGSQMMKKLKTKLGPKGRHSLLLDVSDSNLGMHLFLKKHEFKADMVKREFYDTGQDAYYFVFSVPNYSEVELETQPFFEG